MATAIWKQNIELLVKLKCSLEKILKAMMMIRKSEERIRKASLDMRLHELTNEISWLASQNLNLIVNREPDINN